MNIYEVSFPKSDDIKGIDPDVKLTYRLINEKLRQEPALGVVADIIEGNTVWLIKFRLIQGIKEILPVSTLDNFECGLSDNGVVETIRLILSSALALPNELNSAKGGGKMGIPIEDAELADKVRLYALKHNLSYEAAMLEVIDLETPPKKFILDRSGNQIPVEGEDLVKEAKRYARDHKCSYQEALILLTPKREDNQ